MSLIFFVLFKLWLNWVCVYFLVICFSESIIMLTEHLSKSVQFGSSARFRQPNLTWESWIIDIKSKIYVLKIKIRKIYYL